ncbi:MAG TPA: hypothetical protein VGA62_05800 [Acidimicrobiia bacterium]
MPIGGEDFEGHYRAIAKTSVVRAASGRVAPAKAFTDLNALLAFLPTDAKMRAIYPKLVVDPSASVTIKTKAPAARVPEEQRNVKVACWLYAARSEGDNDFHVIVGSSRDDANATFLNVEVSGLPKAGHDRTLLQQARHHIEALLGSPPPKDRYDQRQPPLHVVVTGSLLFDADHYPHTIGPGTHKSASVWAIHPVISIQPA